MSTSVAEVNCVKSAPAVEINRHANTTAAFGWIQSGINDFRRAPALSLLYGFLFAGLCSGMYLLVRNVPWYVTGYLTGLVVLGPFLAAGLYAASRDMESGSAPSISASLRLMIQRRTYLALFALMLALVMAAWVRFSALLFALKFDTFSPSVEAYTQIFSSSEGWITLSFFGGVGFLLAAAVFLISAVAIPMIVDKDADFITAMQTSSRVVTSNPAAMAVWAATIVALTAVGIASAFVAFAVIFPVLGYATWHSYRALVK